MRCLLNQVVETSRIPLLVGALVAVGTLPGWAQERPTPAASPFLPVGHWAVDAVRRLEAMGLLEHGVDFGDRTMAISDVAGLLASADSAAQAITSGAAQLAGAYQDRFASEFPLYGIANGSGAGAFGRVEAGYETSKGALLTGANGRALAPPTPVQDRTDVAAGGSVGLQLARGASVLGSARLRASEIEVDELYAAVGWRALGAWAGRRPVGFGPARAGVVLSGAVPFDGGGVFLRRPTRLPWLLSAIGPIDFQATLARAPDNGSITDPWFWAARVAFLPHPRLTLGLNRSSMFGGGGNGPTDFSHLISAIIGDHAVRTAENYENQLASIDGRLRVPVGVPLEAYFEWGFEDSAGAWAQVPGIVAGMKLASLPGVPEVGVGAQFSSYEHSCCGNPIWYRHILFTEGWSQDGTLLGDPLGGQGREVRVTSEGAFRAAAIRIRADGFSRDRGEENLYSPDWEGRSLGGSLKVEIDATRRLGFRFDGEAERGDEEWRRSRAEAGIRWVF
jgi:hypothetical protein